MKMPTIRLSLAFAAALGLVFAAATPAAAADRPTPPTKRNLLIFLADGLRPGSVTMEDAPTMAGLRDKGVDFTNTHSVFPTLTTVNGGVVATGHYPGDNGHYANSLYLGYNVQCGLDANVVFVQDDCVLKSIKAHYPQDYLPQDTFMAAARKAGYNTATVGKLGPAAMQDIAALDTPNDSVDGPLGVFMDDYTNIKFNRYGGESMSPPLGGFIANEAFKAAGMGKTPYSSVPNMSMQAYQTAIVTNVLIPNWQISGRPFVLTFWARDPDTTQHGALDSDGNILPGINSYTSRTAINFTDGNLKAIINALKLYGMWDNTDVILLSDHGFSTIGKGIPNPDGTIGEIGLPGGFLAMDVAKWLGGKTIFDPDRSNAELDMDMGEWPQYGNALIGDSAEKPEAIVVANGGSDFIYIPEDGNRRATALKIFAELVKQPYVGALFVDDALMQGGVKDRAFAGALPMSAVHLAGSSKLPRPAIIIGFRTYIAKGCKLDTLMCQVEIADSNYHTGQGMHGTFGRGDTRNFMAAYGPSFKKGVKIDSPVGNIDVAHTAAHLLGLSLQGPGEFKGRAILEALNGGKLPKVKKLKLESATAPDGMKTVVDVQEVGATRYFTAGGMPGRTVGLPEK